MRAKILNASAGSGKTYQLAYKYIHDVIERPELYRHILAVTFTNKATEEMKSRILREIHLLATGDESPYAAQLQEELGLDARTLQQRARDVRSRILHDYSHFTVLTIDTFFQRILRAFIRELGFDLDYNVEIETESLLAKSADSLVEGITENRELKRWLTDFVQERIDDGRRWDIRDGILALSGELFKEKNREALGRALPKEELRRLVGKAGEKARATRRAMQEKAREALRLMEEAGVSPSDFTGKSRSFANYFLAAAGDELKAPSATVERMSRTTEGWCPKGSPAQPLVARLRDICDIFRLNVRLWNTAALLRENYRSFALLADLYAQVQRLCDQESTMLLSETKYILAEFIGHNDAPFIYEKVGNRFERYMIDEFQDTSAREWRNFLPLLHNAIAQSQQISVFLVGDIKQSIYRWRGGDWKILHSEARRELSPADTEVVNLRDNWRSLPTVVEFNNGIMERIVAADNRALNTMLDEAAATGAIAAERAAELHDILAAAYGDHAQVPRRVKDGPGYVSVTACTGEPPLVERIKQVLDRGFRPSDILILVRSATDGARVAAELLRFKGENRDERYCFDVMTREALIVGNAPVAGFLIAALRLTVNTEDTLNRAIYNRFLGRAFGAPLPDDERDFCRALRLLSPEEAFERLVIRHHLAERSDQTAYLQALHEQLISFCSSKIADIPLFLRWWDEQGSSRSLSIEQSERTIEITTVHKAKGLERPVVIIPYCTWQLDPKSSGNVTNIVWARASDEEAAIGQFPVRYKQAMADSEFSEAYYRELVYSHVDNINLLYVALTRAAESLHVFIPTGGKAANVGSLLWKALNPKAEGCPLGKIEGRLQTTEAGEECTFGSFDGPAPRKAKRDLPEHVLLEHYPTAMADLRLRLPSQRYFEEERDALPSPRDFGILMHKAFENAADEEEIRRSVTQMQSDGILSQSEAEALGTMLDEALANPVVREWFAGEWEEVRTESDIILPAARAQRAAAEDAAAGAGKAAVAAESAAVAAGKAAAGAESAAAGAGKAAAGAESAAAGAGKAAAGAEGAAAGAGKAAVAAEDAAAEAGKAAAGAEGSAVAAGKAATTAEDAAAGAGKAATGAGAAQRSSVTRRPDRVMMRSERVGERELRRVVVVDYKFGEHETAGHRRQIAEYMRLLGEMGYDEVKGYLWYIRLRKVVEVSAREA